MKLFDVYPLQKINIVKGAGNYVWDDAGHQYLDMYGGHAVISIGHAHPHWVAAVQHQAAQLAFYSNSVINPLQEQLAELLIELSGKKDYQLFLCNSGAEANENALKLASFHTGRKKVVAFTKSFHGRTALAVAATDNDKYRAPVNQTDNIVFLPYNDEAAIRNYFAEHGKEIAAVIIEAIQGVGGIHIASEAFLQLIRSLCTEYGAVFIADEVQCGYGRSGRFYATDYADVNADIYTMAKGMGNGFPIGGLLIMLGIQPFHGMLGTTFGGNHLACAAAIAVLEVMQSEGLMANAANTGNYIQEQLKQIHAIYNIRGRGLMIGFAPSASSSNLRQRLIDAEYVFTGNAAPDMIRLLPSLALQQKDADLFLEKVNRLMNAGIPV